MSNFERKMGKASLGAVAGIGAAGAGAGIIENQKKYNEDKKEQDKKRIQEKMEKDEPTGSGKESLSKERSYKAGGKISKAVMQKAGFYDKGVTEKERQDIVKKVTTKPQRVAMVAKAFSTKNMNEGGKVGSASKRADGCAIRGKTRA
jgi:hypothetical protein